MERFLRAELSRRENQEIVRHLLTDCAVCRETVRDAARRQGFKVSEELAQRPALVGRAS